jgi:hypothetical protein
MISGPVIPRTHEGLWGQILNNPDLLEHGLQMVAQDLGLHELCAVDGLARDAAGRAVLLIAAVTGEMVGLPVRVLEAHSFLQRNAAVLARALPDTGVRFADAWRVVVVSMGLPDTCLAQIKTLGLDRVEVYEVEPFTLGGESHLVVRPLLGFRAGGGEDQLHIPSGLLDAERREICARFLSLVERLDPKITAAGDRFSRRLTLGPDWLLDLWVEGDRLFVDLGDKPLELAREEDCLEIMDMILRRYLEFLSEETEGSVQGLEERVTEVAVDADEGGLSLAPLRRAVAETRISREEFSALGDPSSIDNG